MNAITEKLASLLPASDVYPKGVVCPILPRIRGRSFFPGGCGFARGYRSPLPDRPIMLVGQDFGTRSYWESLTEEQLEKGEPDKKGTWKGLHSLECSRLIRLDRCFFTNVLAGVRDDVADTSLEIEGLSPGLRFAAYVSASVLSIERQIALLRPSVVVALGTVPATLLARAFGLVSDVWPNKQWRRSASIAGWEEIDGSCLQFVERHFRDDLPAFAFATSVHPSMPNDGDRSWNELRGKDAQNAIWKRVQDRDSQTFREDTNEAKADFNSGNVVA